MEVIKGTDQHWVVPFEEGHEDEAVALLRSALPAGVMVLDRDFPHGVGGRRLADGLFVVESYGPMHDRLNRWVSVTFQE